MSTLRIVGKAASAFYDELLLYCLLGVGHTVSWVLLIPGPFVLAGVYALGQRSVRGLGANWAIIWRGIREYGARSLLLVVVVLVGYAVVFTNLWFYNAPDVSPFPTTVAKWTTPIFAGLGLVWTGMAFYVHAFLVELETPRLWYVVRNSLYLTLLRPLQTLFLVAVALLALAVSIVVPLLLVVWPGFVSALALVAVRTMVGGLISTRPSMADSGAEGIGSP